MLLPCAVFARELFWEAVKLPHGNQVVQHVVDNIRELLIDHINVINPALVTGMCKEARILLQDLKLSLQ